jgi:hypothetical protein
MHRRTHEATTAENHQGANAVRDGEPSECDLCIASRCQEALTCICDPVKRCARNLRRGDHQQGALSPRYACIDPATSSGRVGHSELRNIGAKQREYSVRIVAGVFVDREDLEPQARCAQVVCGSPHGNADCLFVVAKGQNDREVEPEAVRHRRML